MKRAITLSFLASLVGGAHALAAGPCHPGQVIVRLAEETTPAQAALQLDGAGLTLGPVLCPRLDIFLLVLDGSLAVPPTLEGLRTHPALRWAQADHWLEDRLTPDDPEFPLQWNLQQGSDADIDAPEAWDLGTGGTDPLGRPIVVAVVDGGMDLTHPDLAPNAWINSGEIAGNGLDDDGNGFIDDVHGWDAYNNDGSLPFNGHGTHVSGIVGARGDNANQVCGVNWEVGLMTVAGSSSLTSVVVVAYNYVLEQKAQWLESGGAIGANVVASNSSFGVNFANCELGDYPLWNDLYNEMGAVGILSAAATMNTNANVDLQGDVPTSCSSPWLITVTNTTAADLRNTGSAYGATTIDLGAPGTQVRSTYLNGTTTPLTGTSMSSPHVAGAVAFLHAVMSDSLAALVVADPGGAALVIKDLILTTVDPLPSLDGITVSGGRLNLHRAALAAASWPPPPRPVVGIALLPDRRIRLTWDELIGATAYHVEKRESWPDAWQRVDTVPGLSWTSPPVGINARACFRVLAELP
ncbi:MAG: S8 family serine peptidase [bacterium]|jgi:subtilisin family serine protease|nr:S8 family serine peptidase [bacterium]